MSAYDDIPAEYLIVSIGKRCGGENLLKLADNSKGGFETLTLSAGQRESALRRYPVIARILKLLEESK